MRHFSGAFALLNARGSETKFCFLKFEKNFAIFMSRRRVGVDQNDWEESG